MNSNMFHNNTSDGKSLNIPLVAVCFFSSVLGILLNIIVMTISCRRKIVKELYKFYIFNLSFVDCTGAFCYGILALCLCLTYYSPSNDMFTCSLLIFSTDWILTASVACMVPMTIHRRLSFDFARHNWFQKCFSKRALIFFCIIIDLLCCLLASLDYYINACRGSVDSGDLEFCSVLPNTLVDKFSVFHFQEKKVLYEKRNLTLASLAYTIAIILGQMPDQVVSFVDQLGFLSDFTPSQWDDVTFATNLCNVLNFVVNPMMTLIIIKPYREAIMCGWQRKINSATVTPIELGRYVARE
jgi:hypothetical protein